MKLQIAAIALSATLVACGGGSGGDSDDTTIDGVPVIGGGDVVDGDIDIGEQDFDGGDIPIDFGDAGCEGGGSDSDSSTADWNDNCTLTTGLHAQSSYAQGVQRIIFCRGHSDGRPESEIDLFADGIFGLRTDAEIREFQTAEGITSDGAVGPMTWAALQNVIREINAVADIGVFDVIPGVQDPLNPIDCSGVNQFFQLSDGSWTMAETPGSVSSIEFSIGLPFEQ